MSNLIVPLTDPIRPLEVKLWVIIEKSDSESLVLDVSLDYLVDDVLKPIGNSVCAQLM